MPVEQKEKYVTITLEKSYRLEQLINEFLKSQDLIYNPSF